MTATEGKRGPGSNLGPAIGLGAMLTVIVGVLATWVAATTGAKLGNRPLPPSNPVELVLDLLGGKYAWPGALATATAVIEGLVLLLFVLLVVRLTRGSSKRPRVDRAAGRLGKGRDLDRLDVRKATATAARLGAKSGKGVAPGVFIGRSVPGGRPLYGSWEDMHVDIWGPRTGKTTRRAVPAILDAPGAVLVTSNKRDIVDATRGPREAVGPVWVFDPQARAEEPASWWWDPLSYVTDVARARKLAGHFAAGSRSAGATTDAFFDPAGQDLLSGLLLAAACDRKPITQVYLWLTRPKDDTPERILREAGHLLSADAVAGVINAPEKQRGGIYGTAMQMASCLINPAVHPWITPGRDAGRPSFDPHAFVRDGGTLYSLSREGKDSAGPLVTALTVAVVEAAEELATGMPGGRLTVPLLGVLDEAANVCRWNDLPDLYSHYGSRGIILMTILQSWAQGQEVWGEKGMDKLWSASNIRVYGGGVVDTKFLGDLSQLAGEFEALTVSTSRNYGGGSQGGGLFGQGSSSTSTRRERVLDVADLAAMPPGRALVLASGTKPALVSTVPWWEGPHVEGVKASLAKYDPGARR